MAKSETKAAKAAKAILAQDPHAVREPRANNLEMAIGHEVRTFRKKLGITVADLGGASGGKKPAKSKSTAVAKFRGPQGELWAGGPGRKPEWVRAVLASGKSIEDFRI